MICSHRDELSNIVSTVDGWWEDLQNCHTWLGDTQEMLSQHKPLASSVPLLVQQEESVKVRPFA